MSKVDAMTADAKSERLNGAQQDGGGLDASAQTIDRFLDAAWMERGLSRNTLSAYRTDLLALARWMAARGQLITAAERGDVLAFMAERVAAGAQPRS